MLRGLSLAALAIAGLSPVAPARADTAPVIVIPSRPGIPTVINGRNANYAVVEGDWGLARPGHMPQTIIGGSPLAPTRSYAPRGAYFPAYGVAPQRGRHEIEPGPDRPLPPPAEPFHRSWSSSPPAIPPQRSARQPAPPPAEDEAWQERAYRSAPSGDVVPPTISDPNAATAPIIVVPQIGRSRR